MLPLRSFPALPLLAAAALALAVASPAHATSMSTHTVVMTLTLDAATYDFDGSDVNLGGNNSSQDENVFDTLVGNAATNGSSSFTVNGVMPSDPSQFEFGVGDTIVVTLLAEATADGLGSTAGHGRDFILDLEFFDIDEFFENITLEWSWSYTQDASLTNMTAGNQAAAFLDASVLVSNFSTFSDSFFFVQDENFGNFSADTDVWDLEDSGTFETTMDVEGGAAEETLVEITIDVDANAIIQVPEPRLAALLGALTLLLAFGAPRER